LVRQENIMYKLQGSYMKYKDLTVGGNLFSLHLIC